MAAIRSLALVVGFSCSVVAFAQPRPSNAPPDTLADSSQAAIVITGTRIQTPNRRSASPVESVRPEDFTLTGVANVEQTLNQLPQIAPSYTSTSNNPGTGAATLDLRGLGSVRTLVLVNGRRWIANDAGNIPEVDVNTIPASLIDRVDIVTGGASAVYGSDAVTGVINFVLRQNLRGLHIDARNNLTERGDGRVSSADLSYGLDIFRGRGNLLVSVGMLDQQPLTQAARAYTRDALGDGCVIPGTEGETGASTPAPNPDLTCDDPDEELGYIAGGSTFIPEGLIQGGGNTFLPGSGNQLIAIPRARFTQAGGIARYNNDTDAYNFAADNYLQVPLRRYSANILGRVRLTDHFEPYTELSVIQTKSPQQLAPAAAALGTGGGTVPRVRINLDNPFLSAQARQALNTSFGVDAQGRRGFLGSNAAGFTVNPAYTGDADGIVQLPGQFRSRLTGLGPRQTVNERRAYRILVGARGKLSNGPFDYDFYFSSSDVEHAKPLVNSASARRLQQALLTRDGVTCIDPSNGCVPVNIFGVQEIGAAAADFIRANPFENTRVKEKIVEGVVRGSAAQLPAGDLRIAVGGHWRQTSFAYQPDRTLSDGDNLGFQPSVGSAGRTRVVELFGEALVPLLSDRPFARELALEPGFRVSHYNIVGNVWTWKAMAYWSPFAALRFRGGMQKAVRAPNVRELFEEESSAFGGVRDPCAPANELIANPDFAAACARNGAVDLPLGVRDFFPLENTRGSTNLKPEAARTLTLGVVARPFRNLTITADYYDIRIRDAIGIFGGGAQSTVFGCIFGGGDPADPLCRAFERDQSGEIISIDLPTANLARITTRGVDWQAAYRVPLLTGDLSLNLSGTRLLSSTIRPNPEIAPFECAGDFGGVCGGTDAGSAAP
ncbi:TonB-dependent receptor [Sphingomonas lutea]|uniref:TonB-dependent receptor n=1 Tax=Sphingomonas lutea TaxID=1045317 RepID=A0A7G9SJU2_9SPHN|nr:TonB-dependent receptor [Sphingomonas lutea]QNN68117.1 TonB-dependent receptor [Sphingomonas lutea]